MTAPFLSLLIPTYNGSRYIREALDSIAAQQGIALSELEVIVLDDGSQDDTAAIVRGYQASLPLKLVVQPHCGNHTVNSNRLMGMASGMYVCFLHQDDYWLPQRLARLRQVLLAQPELVMLVHPTRFINAARKTIGRITCPLPDGVALPPGEVLPHLLVQNFFTIVSTAIRRDTLRAIGGFDESLWYTGDWDLWLKLCQRGPCYYLRETLSVYRVHRQSQTITHSNIPDFRKQFETVLERHLPQIPTQPHAAAIGAAARASVELNILFFTLLHRTRIEWRRLLLAFLRLSPRAWGVLWRDARLTERIPSRLRAQLKR